MHLVRSLRWPNYLPLMVVRNSGKIMCYTELVNMAASVVPRWVDIVIRSPQSSQYEPNTSVVGS